MLPAIEVSRASSANPSARTTSNNVRRSMVCRPDAVSSVPRAKSALASFLPMKPAPPVITTCIAELPRSRICAWRRPVKVR